MRSNVSGSSSSSSIGGPRGRGRVVGVPKRCWCGSLIWELISKSEHNPYRPYYGCGFSAAKKLKNDEHTFKWVDEAHLNEIDSLQRTNARLEKDLKEILAERNGCEQMLFDRVQVKVEKEIFERMEVVLVESSSRVKKIMIVVVIVCMVMVGCSKLVG